MTDDIPASLRRTPGDRPGERADANKLARTKRKILGGSEAKLSTAQREGYVRRWVNDKGGRLADFDQAAYTFVQNKDAGAKSTDLGDTRVSQLVGTQENGQPLRAYLMEKPKEWYDEDQKEKHRLTTDRTEEAIKRGKVGGEPDQEGRYVPSQGIKVTSNSSSRP